MRAGWNSFLLCAFRHKEKLNTLPPSCHLFSPSASLPPTHRGPAAGQEVSFFTKLNALIKPSDHLGRDKELIPSSSLKLAASALCFAISCHWRTGTRYLTNLGLCLCADKCQSGVRKSQTSLWCYRENTGKGFKKEALCLSQRQQSAAGPCCTRHNPVWRQKSRSHWCSTAHLTGITTEVYHHDLHLIRQCQAHHSSMSVQRSDKMEFMYRGSVEGLMRLHLKLCAYSKHQVEVVDVFILTNFCSCASLWESSCGCLTPVHPSIHLSQPPHLVYLKETYYIPFLQIKIFPRCL